MGLWASTSQTIGPFFSIGLDRLRKDNLVGEGVSGERVTIAGRMLDGDGKPVPDGLVETWQANAHGKYAHPEDHQDKSLEAGFKGYGRVMTDDQGKFQFTTIKPGQAPGASDSMIAGADISRSASAAANPDAAAATAASRPVSGGVDSSMGGLY